MFAANGWSSLAAMLRLAPPQLRPVTEPTVGAPTVCVPRAGRVALLSGCANAAIAPHINAAAKRLLHRHGVEVVSIAGEVCCGAISHHLGRDREALHFVRRNIDAWTGRSSSAGLMPSLSPRQVAGQW